MEKCEASTGRIRSLTCNTKFILQLNVDPKVHLPITSKIKFIG